MTAVLRDRMPRNIAGCCTIMKAVKDKAATMPMYFPRSFMSMINAIRSIAGNVVRRLP